MQNDVLLGDAGRMVDSRSTAAAVKGTIGRLGGGFMISREAKQLCERTGLGPRELYFRGRCGVLGEVDADVVTSAAVFFPPGHVRESWEGGRKLAVEEAVELYTAACHAWGRRKLGAVEGCVRIADLLEKVAGGASVLGAPLFAGWRAVPLPDDRVARATQLMHVVRELRGGVHAIAILSKGLDALTAALATDHEGTPIGLSSGRDMARFFTWPEPYPAISEETAARRREAEDLTDELMAPAFAVLTDAERDELVTLMRLGHVH
ncbi:hypothetical protein ACFXJ8_09680 [Nonomuraea sp. NPDC059194]|uniref:SCO6745 family protein n=1 Tax=Nonomuraea sp. NPDC059194 TaxID=3346764 RepID=UPI00367B4105